MCIYYQDKEGLTYNSGEHIIPAGLGGKAKLEAGIVSDQFNNDFSKLEQDFLRESIIAGVRQITGPGSRGRQSEKHQAKSKVHVFRDQPDENVLSLGYIKKAKPFLVPHIVLDISTGGFSVGFNNEPEFSAAEAGGKLAAKMANPESLRIRSWVDHTLPANIVLFGIADGIEENYNAFLALPEEKAYTMSEGKIKHIGAAIKQACETKEQGLSKNRILSRQTVKWKDEYFRVYGKMALNALAFYKGPVFVAQPAFDPVRSWIISGGENDFAVLVNNEKKLFETSVIEWPEDAHIILFFNNGREIQAFCGLYNHMFVQIGLCAYIQERVNGLGFICDWKNGKEYNLQEYIASYIIKNNGTL